MVTLCGQFESYSMSAAEGGVTSTWWTGRGSVLKNGAGYPHPTSPTPPCWMTSIGTTQVLSGGRPVPPLRRGILLCLGHAHIKARFLVPPPQPAQVWMIPISPAAATYNQDDSLLELLRTGTQCLNVDRGG